ncbi:MAG: DNA-binding protein HU [Methylotenera sp.]|uniref:HU family DNA-binding protein n=1 Tax=Methylotenera sp. TaxID=2051956 RepID=UPI000D4D6286|nr:HU family DNA-binding protein [Methylotenera sp.]PPC84416.1 MAG: DNA-binding protein HU [Methylotenera sp.]PPD01057.1 MAG: DNA-binding protein HU [Methylotenera sp.]
MNKRDLSIIVAQKAGISNSSAARAIDATIASISESLSNGVSVRLTGFGTFKVSRTKARQSRNPRTGEPINVKAKNRPAFVAGQSLKVAVN